MGRIIKEAIVGNIPFYILAGISAALLIAGFICPPLAIIDNSVLVASGELIGWGALSSLIKAIDEGLNTTMKHKDTEISVSKKNGKHTEDN